MNPFNLGGSREKEQQAYEKFLQFEFTRLEILTSQVWVSILLTILGINYILEGIAGYMSHSHDIEEPFGREGYGLWGSSVIEIILWMNDSKVLEWFGPPTFTSIIGFMFAADVFTYIAPLTILLTD